MRRPALFTLLVVFLILAVWELACRGFNVPDFILPTPSQISMVAVFKAALLLPHAGTTAMEVLIGILISLLVAVPLLSRAPTDLASLSELGERLTRSPRFL